MHGVDHRDPDIAEATVPPLLKPTVSMPSFSPHQLIRS
jgi:hypothetical protein